MARTVDPARHEARRLQIIDAALTRFAADGFDRATTASICREAGIGSGTFFHYFPTKLALLLAILELGTAETTAWFSARSSGPDARRVIDEYVEQALADLGDPRMAGFVRAVGSVMADPQVASALAADSTATSAGLTPLVAAAQASGEVRSDVGADRLARWLVVVLDGFLDQVATLDDFTVAGEADLLRDTVARLLAP